MTTGFDREAPCPGNIVHPQAAAPTARGRGGVTGHL